VEEGERVRENERVKRRSGRVYKSGEKEKLLCLAEKEKIK